MFCPACRRAADRFLPAGSRPGARCPGCQALERHRFLALLVDLLEPWLEVRAGVVLDVAPMRIVRRLIADRVDPRVYLGVDLSTHRDVSLVADVAALPAADASVDLAIAYHVLEHVGDDAAAIAELARVLRPAGVALLQVPRRPEQATDDGPLVPPETPAGRFGQGDHLRWYGWDFEQRLRAGGLEPTLVRPADVCTAATRRRLGLLGAETVWLCRRRGVDGRPGAGHGDLLRALLAGRERSRLGGGERRHLEAEVGRLTAQRDAAREEAAANLASYQRLASHPVVRVLRRLRALLR